MDDPDQRRLRPAPGSGLTSPDPVTAPLHGHMAIQPPSPNSKPGQAAGHVSGRKPRPNSLPRSHQPTIGSRGRHSNPAGGSRLSRRSPDHASAATACSYRRGADAERPGDPAPMCRPPASRTCTWAVVIAAGRLGGQWTIALIARQHARRQSFTEPITKVLWPSIPELLLTSVPLVRMSFCAHAIRCAMCIPFALANRRCSDLFSKRAVKRAHTSITMILASSVGLIKITKGRWPVWRC